MSDALDLDAVRIRYLKGLFTYEDLAELLGTMRALRGDVERLRRVADAAREQRRTVDGTYAEFRAAEHLLYVALDALDGAG